MKKVLLIAVAAMISATSFSQTSKGTWMVGGSAGFNSYKTSGASNSTSMLTIAPSAGYFIDNNLALGAGVAFVSLSSSGSTASTFNVGPMARYYFTEMGKNAKLFAHANFGFGSTSATGSSSVSSTSWGIKAGPAFFLNKNVALEATVGYGSSKVKDMDAENNFGVNFGFQIHL
jgi:Outer membrane protein beta-barrel domain